jgi:hypothetical protein
MNENKQVLDSLRRKQKQLQDDLKHVEAVIRLYEAEKAGEESIPTLVPLKSLKGLTQIEALVKIAIASGGKFRIADARALLVRAGLINSPKGNANNILFNAIARSEKFERVGYGEYKLTENPNKKILADNLVASEKMKSDHPKVN